MTPYYDDGTCVIYHGDCRDVLADLPDSDLVFADPPYGIGVAYESYEDTEENLVQLIETTFPLMVEESPLICITPGVLGARLWPKPTWTLAWVPDNSATGRSPWGFSCWQPVNVYGSDPFLRAGLGGRPDVIRTAASGKDLRLTSGSGHPCPKPLSVMRAIIGRCLGPHGQKLIVDPFMGIGTTLLAAKGLLHTAIGIELEEKYCEIAAKRLAQGALDLFGEASA